MKPYALEKLTIVNALFEREENTIVNGVPRDQIELAYPVVGNAGARVAECHHRRKFEVEMPQLLPVFWSDRI